MSATCGYGVIKDRITRFLKQTPDPLVCRGIDCSDLVVSLLVSLATEKLLRGPVYGMRLALSGLRPASRRLADTDIAPLGWGNAHGVYAIGAKPIDLGGCLFFPAIDNYVDLLRSQGLPIRATISPLPPATSLAQGQEDHYLGCRGQIAGLTRTASAELIAAGDLSPPGAWLEFAALAAELTGIRKTLVMRWFRRQLSLAFNACTWFASQFRAARPASAAVYGGMSAIACGLVRAANEAGVPTFELQHGALPLINAYDGTGRVGAHTPRAHVSWIAQIGTEREYVIGAPSRFLDDHIHRRGNARGEIPEPAGLAYEECRNALSRMKDGHKVALLTQQGPTGAERPFEAGGIRVWKRPHPGRSTRALGSRNRKSIITGAMPLGPLLEAADFHITRFSGSALEAHAWGVPTFFTHEFGPLLFPWVDRLDHWPPAAGEANVVRHRQDLANLADRHRLVDDLKRLS